MGFNMLRTLLIGFVLLSLGGCSSMYDGMEGLGTTGGDIHAMSVEEAQNLLEDKTIFVGGHIANVIYFAPTGKAYFWNDFFDSVKEIDWKSERSSDQTRHILCFVVPFENMSTNRYGNGLFMYRFLPFEVNDNYRKECADYTVFAVASKDSERSDVFNLSSKVKPNVQIANWLNIDKTYVELKSAFEKSKNKSQ